MIEQKKKKVTRVRLRMNIHVGGGRVVGKGSIISGSEGWLIDMIHANQAEEVSDSTPLKDEPLEHVKPLRLFSGETGQPMTPEQLKAIGKQNQEAISQAVKEAIEANNQEWEKRLEELKKELAEGKKK